MVSFDVSSLYTNVPVIDTLNLLCDSIFGQTSSFQDFDRRLFMQFLRLAVQDTYFMFDGILHKQTEGLAMGNPSAPTLANIFLCNLEKRFLNTCPSEFKPVFYRLNLYF